jgi:hypothetical protein
MGELDIALELFGHLRAGGLDLGLGQDRVALVLVELAAYSSAFSSPPVSISSRIPLTIACTSEASLAEVRVAFFRYSRVMGARVLSINVW